MEPHVVVERYRRLQPGQQIRVLALFGHSMTIAGRETYEVQSSAVRAPERLRAVNEIQHLVLSQIAALANADDRRYDDESLIAIVLDQDDAELRAQAVRAFEDVLMRIAE